MSKIYISKSETTLKETTTALENAVEIAEALLHSINRGLDPMRFLVVPSLERSIQDFKRLSEVLLTPEPLPGIEAPPMFTPLPLAKETVPVWTITAHAADGTHPMTATRLPGQPIKLKGDVSFLIAIANEIAHLAQSPPN
jgi:hypothetical protein